MSTDESFDSHLQRAARRILQPLVRILIRNGITATVFQELARKVFVDVAYKEFEIEGKPQTLARVSVLTGLNRKEVARLHKVEETVEGDRAFRNRAETVLVGWLSDTEFQTNAGFPLDLDFSGGSPNFTDLVKKYSGDMYPRSVADELLRVGAIESVDGKLRLMGRGYVPSKDPAATVDILGLDTADLIETIDHNIQAGPNEKLLQYIIRGSNVPEEFVEEFNRYSRQVSMNAVDEITTWLVAHDKGKDYSGNDRRFEVGVGVFQINRIKRDVGSEDDQ